ncbi:MAG: hypothetical protein KJ706_08130 [Candidatus Omnitrophica bacterium]|nr:hypothetical protein [Candidatus Omnitrophota bacterium]
MKWDEFQRRKRIYKDVWSRLKKDFNGDIRKFLDKSYLVITYGFKQMSFETDDISSIAIDYPDFFIYDRHSEALIKLVDEYKVLKKRLEFRA